MKNGAEFSEKYITDSISMMKVSRAWVISNVAKQGKQSGSQRLKSRQLNQGREVVGSNSFILNSRKALLILSLWYRASVS